MTVITLIITNIFLFAIIITILIIFTIFSFQILSLQLIRMDPPPFRHPGSLWHWHCNPVDFRLALSVSTCVLSVCCAKRAIDKRAFSTPAGDPGGISQLGGKDFCQESWNIFFLCFKEYYELEFQLCIWIFFFFPFYCIISSHCIRLRRTVTEGNGDTLSRCLLKTF